MTEEKNTTRKLSRRHFLKTTGAVAAAGVVTGGPQSPGIESGSSAFAEKMG